MNYETIYEFNNKISPFSVPFTIIFLFFIVILIFAFKRWKRSDVGEKIGLVIIPLLTSVVVVAQLVTFFQTEHLIFEYKNNRCEVVEGTIYDYEQKYDIGTMSDDHKPDRFFVNGQEFIVCGYQTYGVEYYLRQSDGSKLKNGQYVKIYYSYFKHENIILKIELLE